MPGVANCFSKANPLTRLQIPWFHAVIFLLWCIQLLTSYSKLKFIHGGEVLTDNRGRGGGAIGIVQKVGRCTRTGEILISHQQHCPSAKLTCLEAGAVSCLGFYQNPKQWSMRTSAHPDGKESLGAANDEKKNPVSLHYLFFHLFCSPFHFWLWSSCLSLDRRWQRSLCLGQEEFLPSPQSVWVVK